MKFPIWRLAFRPFFLAGTLFAVLAIAAWAAVLSGHLALTPYGGATFWHGHEMLFGFAVAIVTGFLLTAVQTWSGLRATHGLVLILLFLLWLLGRVLMLVGAGLPAWLVMTVDVSFAPMVALLMAQLVLKSKNYRNLFFVPVLLLLGLANLLTHFHFAWGIYAAVLLVSLLMVVIGGRVIPMFTANGTHTPKVEPVPWLEWLTLGAMWLIALIYVTHSVSLLPAQFLAVLFAVASLSNIVRSLRWRPWVTLRVPLVWILHAAYWFIPLGLGLFALHFAGVDISASTAMHALTAGAMGSLILAMVARVSLGHTGRPLQVHPAMIVAFGLVVFAGLLRVLTGAFPALLGAHAHTVTALAWTLAYGIFLWCYFGILTSARIDGKDG